MVPRGELSPYQCAGDESSCFGSGSLSAPVVGSECCPDEQQRLGYRLPLESPFYRMTAKVVLRTERHLVSLSASYILGRKTVLADQLSHPDWVLPSEWSLLPASGILGNWRGLWPSPSR